MDGLDLLQDLAIVTGVAGVAAWICQRIGLSSVVGFLLAGIAIGPHTPPFAFVSDEDRIHTLSQLGLVFLMFSIGMGLSIRRLQRMGIATLIATAIGAILVLILGRWTGMLIGWTSTQSLFFAALLMTSSSAIISKVLHEIGAMHEPASRRAMAITILEDVVAVVMLTVLTSVSAAGGESGPPVAQTLGLILLFVMVLVIAGLLIVPRILQVLAKTSDMDLQTILVAGLVLGTALLAVRAGYSLALGAFLLGAIVAGTPQRPQIERYFQGVRDIFTAVFFVSIGMLMNISILAESWLLVLMIGAGTIILRTLVTSTAMILVGLPTRDAVRSGAMLTPIGEFSFIIAQLGVTTGGAPELIYPLAVGVSLFTALTAPIMIKNSSPISRFVDRVQPKFLREIIGYYHAGLEKIRERQTGNPLWQITMRPLRQLALWVLFVSGVLAFSTEIYDAVYSRFGASLPFPLLWQIAFWAILAAVAAGPLVAIWRNLSALALIYAEAITGNTPEENSGRRPAETVLQLIFGFAMAIWLWLLLPIERGAIWTAAAVVFLLAIMILVLRHRLTRIHSKVEIELREALESSEEGARERLLHKHTEWDIHAHEIVLPDQAECSGTTIADLHLRPQFGCSIAGVDRHGFTIPNPPPDLVLYPGDKLLILATDEQIQGARKFLTRTLREDERTNLIDEIEIDGVEVPEGSPAAGNLLVELEIPAATGVQLVGIERDGRRLLNPGPFQGIEEGDRLLAIGTPEQIRQFERWLKKPAEPAPAESEQKPGGDGTTTA